MRAGAALAECTATDQKAPPGLKTVTALWPARISDSSSCQLSGYWKRIPRFSKVAGIMAIVPTRARQGNRPKKMKNRRGGGLDDLLPFGGLSELGKNAPNCLGHTACSLPVADSGVPLGRAAPPRSRLADRLADPIETRQRASGTEAAREGRSQAGRGRQDLSHRLRRPSLLCRSAVAPQRAARGRGPIRGGLPAEP